MSKEVNKYNYTPLPEPVPITEQVWPEDQVALVQTRTMAFNHEKFIRECIEGLLMQKTTFPVQILIHDDASTDNTAAIIKEYEVKYPRLIKAYYQEENSYSKSSEEKSRLRKTFFQWITGKYQALCEGDDYWVDPLKLQKQISFLEENPEYVLSHTNCNFLFEEKRKLIKSANKSDPTLNNLPKDKLFLALIEEELKIQTASVVIKTGYSNEMKSDKRFKMGDTPFWLILSQFGKFHYINEPTVVYRFSRGSITRPTARIDRVSFRLSGLLMRFYYLEKYNYRAPISVINKFSKCLTDYIKLGGEFKKDYEKYLTNNEIKDIKRLEKRLPILNRIDYYASNPRILAFNLKETIKYQII